MGDCCLYQSPAEGRGPAGRAGVDISGEGPWVQYCFKIKTDACESITHPKHQNTSNDSVHLFLDIIPLSPLRDGFLNFILVVQKIYSFIAWYTEIISLVLLVSKLCKKSISFLRLAFFTKYHVFETHTGWWMELKLLHFHCYVVFHYINLLQFTHSFIDVHLGSFFTFEKCHEHFGTYFLDHMYKWLPRAYTWA